jgi:hypothetical protein
MSTATLYLIAKAFVRSIYRARYGVRGAIKPPINWNRANSPLYRYQYFMWQIEDRIYNWTGLPKLWWAEMSKASTPHALMVWNRDKLA